MEIDGRYEKGIITNEKILLWNKGERPVHPLTDIFLTNVNVKLCENGAVGIEADRNIFEFYARSYYGRKVYGENWRHTPHPSEIHTGRPWWKKLLNIGKDKKYVHCGWVRTEETEPVRFMLSHYQIEVTEDNNPYKE